MVVSRSPTAQNALTSPLNRRGRRTPCRNVCSTTYGDVVCRGCKRFSHEINQWNRLSEARQERIWKRLASIYDESISACVRVSDVQLFNSQSQEILDDSQPSMASAIYELLQRADASVSELGLTPVDASDRISAMQLFEEIEEEIYQRSLAYFQYSFKQTIDQV